MRRIISDMFEGGMKMAKTLIAGLLILAVLLASQFNVVATRDDIKDVLRQDLRLGDADQTVISYLGEFAIDDDYLFWFSIHNQAITYYRAVECHLMLNGNYRIRKIHKPMTYAQDIVHVVWMTEDIFLINNSSCRSIIYMNESGDVIAQTEIAPNEIPYVYLHKTPVKPCSCDFLDSTGEAIR